MRGERLVPGNASSPTVSPDGRWVVTVPVERGSARHRAELPRPHRRRAVDRTARRRPSRWCCAFDLPGASAMPAFSVDGEWLYFTQFLNDTNLDGAIDGNDHGVLFRAAFHDG